MSKNLNCQSMGAEGKGRCTEQITHIVKRNDDTGKEVGYCKNHAIPYTAFPEEFTVFEIVLGDI